MIYVPQVNNFPQNNQHFANLIPVINQLMLNDAIKDSQITSLQFKLNLIKLNMIKYVMNARQISAPNAIVYYPFNELYQVFPGPITVHQLRIAPKITLAAICLFYQIMPNANPTTQQLKDCINSLFGTYI